MGAKKCTNKRENRKPPLLACGLPRDDSTTSSPLYANVFVGRGVRLCLALMLQSGTASRQHDRADEGVGMRMQERESKRGGGKRCQRHTREGGKAKGRLVASG